MRKLRRWWRSLEEVPGLAGVSASWQRLLGPEYELLGKFFRPNGARAQSIPCPAKKDCGRQHAVVEHAPDHVVAVCQCEPRRCETLPITRSDTVIYEINRTALTEALASALGIEHEETEISGIYQTFRLGTYSPLAGFEFPVFITMQLTAEDLQRVAATLMTTNDVPMILLVPTRRLLTPSVVDLVDRKKSMLLALDILMGLGEDGEFRTEPSAESLLARFRDLHLPVAAKTSSMVFFPTPPGSSWENVTIRFVDGHRVSVKVKSETGVFNYTEMGMASSKNGEPTVQWKLLADFAEEHGVINWRSPKADPNLKKRKSKLARDLCEFFRIEGDPFIYEENDKGWRARFNISAG